MIVTTREFHGGQLSDKAQLEWNGSRLKKEGLPSGKAMVHEAIRDSLEKGTRWLSWRWLIGCMVGAFFFGFMFSWAISQRSIKSLAFQISQIQQNTAQQPEQPQSQPQLKPKRAKANRGR